ncbi:hypothetical protein D3Z62_28230, partial [Lachnospiraceae bacterium]|nr:hypothetical protein [Lachnospiraceae bacterium]
PIYIKILNFRSMPKYYFKRSSRIQVIHQSDFFFPAKQSHCPNFVKNLGNSKILLTFPHGFYTMIKYAGNGSHFLLGKAAVEAFFWYKQLRGDFTHG